MRVGIISPTDQELQPFLEKVENVETYVWGANNIYTGTYSKLDVVCIRCGMGKVNAASAAQKVIDTYAVDVILLSGVAGAIDETLEIGDVVINDKVAYHDVDNKMVLIDSYPNMSDRWFYMDVKLVYIFEKINEMAMEAMAYECKIIVGAGVTGEQFITDDGRDDIEKRFKPMTVDMETGAIAHVAYINQVPFASIRSITDTPSKTGVGTFLENLDLASKNAVWVLENFLQVFELEYKN